MLTAGQGTIAQDPAGAEIALVQGVQAAPKTPLSQVHTVDAATAGNPDTVGSRQGTRTGHSLGRVKMFYMLLSKALVWGHHTGVWRRARLSCAIGSTHSHNAF